MGKVPYAVRLERVRTLVGVGDDDTGRQFNAAFKALGMSDVRTAVTAEAIEREFGAHEFDLVVLDAHLTRPGACELARMFRSKNYGQGKIPIMLACRNQPNEVQYALAREHELAIGSIDDADALLRAITVSLTGPEKPTLLVVEDNKDVAEMIQFALSDDFEVEMAADGAQGLAAWKDRKHDLVILDLQLPKLNGDEILQRIKQTDENQPVIVVTAHGTQDKQKEMIFAGALEFLPKPFLVTQLREACFRALRSCELERSGQKLERAESLARKLTASLVDVDAELTRGRAWVAAEQVKTTLTAFNREAFKNRK